MSRRPNTTQRSWSNYEGDNPIKRWVGKPSYGPGARSYTDSSKFGPGSTWTERKKEEEELPEGYEIDPKTGERRRKESSWEKLQRESALKRGMDEESSWEKLQRESALKRGMDEVKKSKRVEGDEDIYAA
jgi:hypothetical protein